MPGEQILAQQEVMFFGVGYAEPVVVDWPGTIVAVNVGGVPSQASCRSTCSSDTTCGCVAYWLRPASRRCATLWPARFLASELRCQRSFPRSRPRSWHCCCHVAALHRWHTSAAALERSSGPICSILGWYGDWVRLWLRSGAPARSTGFSRRRHRGRPHKSLPAGAGQIDLAGKVTLVGARIVREQITKSGSRSTQQPPL